jgi:hypothetical protein
VESTFGGSLESGGLFCVGAFVRNLASIAVKFSHLICFREKCYKYCTFTALGMSCTERFTPVNSDGSYYTIVDWQLRSGETAVSALGPWASCTIPG